jgi:hypothetical protein
MFNHRHFALLFLMTAELAGDASEAFAQVAQPPSNAVQRPPRENVAPVRKDPSVARAYAVLGTLVPIGIYALGAHGLDGRENDSLMTIGIAGILIGPSAGHFYASGKVITTGAVLRGGGTLVGMLGVGAYAMNALGCSNILGPPLEQTSASCLKTPDLVVALLTVGGTLLLAGTVYDISTAGDEARRENSRHRLSLQPAIAQGRDAGHTSYGLALGGTF